MLKKIFVISIIAVAGFFLTLFMAMCIVNSPTYAWRVLRYFESDTQDYKIFPERIIENGSTSSIIPRGDQGTPYEIDYEYNGETHDHILDELLKRTDTRAFLIIKDDQLIFETYLESSRKEINTSFSSAKSFNSAMIGAAIADGNVDSVNDPVMMMGERGQHANKIPQHPHPLPVVVVLHSDLRVEHRDHRHTTLHSQNSPNKIHCHPASADADHQRRDPLRHAGRVERSA